MLWLLLAFLAHFGNGLVFIIDKALLGTEGKVGQPIRLAFYSGALSLLALALLPFSYAPLTGFMTVWSAIAGFFFLGALWLFYAALKKGEPSRVVPITGSAVPIFTALIAISVLGESLSPREWLGIALLIGGGLLLSIRLSSARAVPPRVAALAILGGGAFAAHFAAMKFLYEATDLFVAPFVYSRVAVGVLALLILGPLIAWTSLGRIPSLARSVPQVSRGLAVAAAFFGSKALGTAAFMVQNYAIGLGSVTVVNALQGTQYLFVLVLAALVSVWFPKLFVEELKRVSILQKIAGIVLISAGLILVV